MRRGCYDRAAMLTAAVTPQSVLLPDDQPNPALQVARWVEARRHWFFGLLILLYASAFNGAWHVGPDQALYATLGRNLAAGDGYTYNLEHHKWVEPLTPLIIAAGARLVGDPQATWPAMVVMLCLALGSLALFYQLLKLTFDRTTAVVVTLLLGFSDRFFNYAFSLMTDQPFLITEMVFLIGYALICTPRPIARVWRGVGWMLVPLGVFLMFSARPVAFTILAALGGAVVYHICVAKDWRTRIRYALLGVLAIVAMFAFRAVDPRRTAPSGQHSVAAVPVAEAEVARMATERTGFVIVRMVTRYVPMIIEETTVTALLGNEIAPVIDTAIAVVAIGLGILLARREPLWGLMVAGTVGQMLFFLPRERYFLPVLPLMLLALWLALVRLNERLSPKAGGIWTAAFLVVFLATNVARIVGRIYEQRQVPMMSGPTLSSDDRKQLPIAEAMKAALNGEDIVVAKYDRLLHLLSGRRTATLPTMKRIEPLKSEVIAADAAVMARRNIYGVLPDVKVSEFAERNGLQIGPALNEGESQLHRLYRPGERVE